MTDFSNASTRRAFLAASALAAISAPVLAQQQGQQRKRQRVRNPDGGPMVIASGNGLQAVERAHEMLTNGADTLDAIVDGVSIVENDPNDMSVGYGGLPNEDGVVELDSCVMHGPTHRAGGVAALRNIKNPAAVAREVARRTDHCLIVGEGALRFARHLGFKEENLLTEKAREHWLRWRSTLNRNDDWLQKDEFDLPSPSEQQSSAPAHQDAQQIALDARDDILWINGVPHTTGTIHCSALAAPGGDLSGCTTTSGLSWKLPGRVGDSPIIGAGNYTDNDIGSAGATGRGEAVIQICGARTIVMRMEMGKTTVKRLLNDKGQPNFNVVFYAVNKDGQYGSACMRGKRTFAIATTSGARLEDCASLYD
jgi:N4-(beta-N-acetylglucosaminyl)-L-asparaginase